MIFLIFIFFCSFFSRVLCLALFFVFRIVWWEIIMLLCFVFNLMILNLSFLFFRCNVLCIGWIFIKDLGKKVWIDLIFIVKLFLILLLIIFLIILEVLNVVLRCFYDLVCFVFLWDSWVLFYLFFSDFRVILILLFMMILSWLVLLMNCLWGIIFLDFRFVYIVI